MTLNREKAIEALKGIPRNAYGDSYYQALLDIPDTEKYVKAQSLYILSNLVPKTKGQREQMIKLMKMCGLDDESIRETLLETISSSFERFTEDDVRMQDKIDLQYFMKFSEVYGYELKDVMEANPWQSGCLDQDVIDYAESKGWKV